MTVVAFGLAALASGAQAHTWVFDWVAGQTGSGADAGQVRSIRSVFDTSTNRLSYEFTINKRSGQASSLVNGFYLAMNDGPNPKGKTGELAMLYFDATDSSSLSLTAYGYNGSNAESWRDGSNASGTQAPDKILSSRVDSSWVNNLSFRQNADGSRTMGFDIDATRINNHSPLYPSQGVDWEGIAFNQKVGIWFGAAEMQSVGFGADGFLTSFSMGRKSFVDTSNLNAVPEPATMTVLVAAGLMAAARRRKKA